MCLYCVNNWLLCLLNAVHIKGLREPNAAAVTGLILKSCGA
jgi:hypothetical protein